MKNITLQKNNYFSSITLLFLTSISFLFILGLTACSSTPKKELAANANPTEELAQLESSVEAGYANHYEVLAENDFSKAVKYRDEARTDLQKGKSSEKVLDSIAYGDALIERAKQTADSRRASVESILLAREAALSAGVRHSPLEKNLGKIDDRMRDSASKFSKLTPKEYNRLQADYLDLEILAIQDRELASSEKLIGDAEKSGAKNIAPKSHQAALKDLNIARNAIEADRHNSSAYQRSVKASYLSAKMLSEVTDTINASDRKTNEDAAIQIVSQRESIKNLQNNVATIENQNKDLSHSILAQKTEVNKLRNDKQFQEAIVAVQKDFDQDEAEVFQQNDKVLIRLKKINFPVGSANIPEKSKPLLTKISEIASRLDAKDIVVEGHTDATGSSKKNLELSKNRAEAVSEYFQKNNPTATSLNIESEGYGYEKPIASNKTKSGRAQNRRVDVIITPGKI